jgi:hypothetical protein
VGVAAVWKEDVSWKTCSLYGKQRSSWWEPEDLPFWSLCESRGSIVGFDARSIYRFLWGVALVLQVSFWAYFSIGLVYFSTWIPQPERGAPGAPLLIHARVDFLCKLIQVIEFSKGKCAHFRFGVFGETRLYR